MTRLRTRRLMGGGDPLAPQTRMHQAGPQPGWCRARPCTAPPRHAPAWDPGLVSCADRSRESDQRLRPQEALRPADIEGPGAGASRTTGVRG